VSYWILAALWIASSLLASYDVCLGCFAFYLLMRAGCIPADVCEACKIQFELEPDAPPELLQPLSPADTHTVHPLTSPTHSQHLPLSSPSIALH
jgi:hypothetical protein